LEKRLENLKKDAGKKLAQLKEQNSTLEKAMTTLKDKAKERINDLQQQLAEAKGSSSSPSASLASSTTFSHSRERDLGEEDWKLKFQESETKAEKIEAELQNLRSKERSHEIQLQELEEAYTKERCCSLSLSILISI
jgi:chromosome segregation ATPase